jgi:acetate kinase
MILIFDPQPPFIVWYKMTESGFEEKKCIYQNGWEKEVSADLGVASGVSYVLYNGGDEISTSPITIDRSLITSVEKVVPLSPDRNQMTLAAIRYCYEHMPAIRHTLVCETVLYDALPSKSRNYAVPLELREKGVKRYGGYGLQHGYMMEKVKSVLDNAHHKVVSVFLGAETNVVAFEDGRPIETSIGFSPAEGIPSLHGCGDTDASFVFLMQEAGWALKDIAPVFSQRGGLCALLGKADCSFGDVISSGVDNIAYKILRYSVIKYIGSAIAQLGGTDVFLIHGENGIELVEPFIRDICRNFDFIGLSCADTYEKTKKDLVFLSGEESSVKILYVQCTRPELLRECVSHT